MGQPAVFLDRDGTLIEEVGYPTRPEQIRILGGVARGLARLAEAGFKRIVVTNQSGIARGLMTEDDLDRFHEALDEQLDLLGAAVDAYYVCPHLPDRSEAVRPDLAIGCDCRKPKPGLILQAAEDLDIDLGASWTIGDTWRDVQAGQAAGLRTIKLPAPPGRDAPRPADVPPPTAEAEDFEEAVALILGDNAKTVSGTVSETESEEKITAELPLPPVVAVPAPSEAAPTEAEERRPAAPTDAAVCARCGQKISPAALASGAAGPRAGRLLCAECLAHQPPEVDEAAAARTGDTGTLLYAMLKELRHMSRVRRPESLPLVRLFAYVIQAVTIFIAVWGFLNQDRPMFFQAALFLQLVVVTLLLVERKP